MLEHTTFARREVMAATLGAVAFAATPLADAQTKPPTPANPDVEKLKALLDSYISAFSAHDLEGVLKHFTPDAVVIGTGAGEIWGGSEEIGKAYKNFFQVFDKGKQSAEQLFLDSNVIGGMAWLLAVTKMKVTKGGKASEFGLNSSLVFERQGGNDWRIRMMHISNVTPGGPAKR
jgi:uncharacterized protein (TIGR02246 family)